MPTHIENELGLGPTMHRFRRWLRRLAARMGLVQQDQRMLDPLTVNYAAWRAVRSNVREWPQYQEAPNSIEVLVSPEDWDEYWGIDADRKEAGVAAYVRARAAERGLWMAGEPQVLVVVDDTMEVGETEVVCQFVEPEEDAGLAPAMASDTAEHEPVVPRDEVAARPSADAPTPPTTRFVRPDEASEAYLVGEGGFRLTIRSGDCIGAVRAGADVPPEVNLRLDAEGFPYVAVKQCTLGVTGGRWTALNHAAHGTRLLKADGTRLMLGEPVPYPLDEGDVLYLGPERPLRFSLS